MASLTAFTLGPVSSTPASARLVRAGLPLEQVASEARRRSPLASRSPLSWSTTGLAAGVAVATVCQRRRAAARRCGCTTAAASGAAADDEWSATKEAQSMFSVIEVRSRRSAAAAVGLAAAAAVRDVKPADAEELAPPPPEELPPPMAAPPPPAAVKVDKKEAQEARLAQLGVTCCIDCGGEGLQECGSCKGSGQFKMIGDRAVGEGAKYQYVECPDCYGAGQKVCEKCLGTGLPRKRLQGFLREPAFRQVVQRLRTQKVEVTNIKEVQAEVQEVVAQLDAARAKKKALEAEGALEEEGGFFGLPSLPKFF